MTDGKARIPHYFSSPTEAFAKIGGRYPVDFMLMRGNHVAVHSTLVFSNIEILGLLSEANFEPEQGFKLVVHLREEEAVPAT